MIHNMLNHLNKLNMKCQYVSSTQLSKYHICCGGLCHKLVVWRRLLHTHTGVGRGVDGSNRKRWANSKYYQGNSVWNCHCWFYLFYIQKEKHAQITKKKVYFYTRELKEMACSFGNGWESSAARRILSPEKNRKSFI